MAIPFAFSRHLFLLTQIKKNFTIGFSRCTLKLNFTKPMCASKWKLTTSHKNQNGDIDKIIKGSTLQLIGVWLRASNCRVLLIDFTIIIAAKYLTKLYLYDRLFFILFYNFVKFFKCITSIWIFYYSCKIIK